MGEPASDTNQGPRRGARLERVLRRGAILRPVCDAATAAGVGLLFLLDNSAVGSVVTAVGLGLGTLLNTSRRASLLRAALVSASMTLLILRGDQAAVPVGTQQTRVLLVLTVAVTCAMLAERRGTAAAEATAPAPHDLPAGRREPLEFERRLARTEGRFAVMAVGLDNLRMVGRLWGPDVATAAVRSVDRVIGDWSASTGAPYAQTGRDEFSILLANAGPVSVRAAADRLLLEAAASSEDGLRASISIGWAVGGDAFGTEDSGPLRVWEAAREALALARERGGGGVLRAGDQRPADIISANPLQRLVATIPIRAMLEPVVDLRTGAVLAVEAVARPVSAAADGAAADLFAAAREVGAAAELADVCRLAGVAAFARVPMALQVQLNVAMVGSAETAGSGAEELADLVDTIGRPCSSVVIGLSDGGYLDSETLVEMAAAYSDHGFLIAVDGAADVDTLAWLVRRLRPAVVKVDRVMLARTLFSATQRHEVGALVAYAAGLGVQIVAKAIETPEMLDRVAGMGITAGQGRLLDSGVGMARREVTASAA